MRPSDGALRCIGLIYHMSEEVLQVSRGAMENKYRSELLKVFGLLLALGLPWLPFSRWENEFASVGHLAGYELIWWTIVTIILLYVLFVERRPLCSIGFHKLGFWNILFGILAGAVSLVSLYFIYLKLFPLFHVNQTVETTQMNQLIATPFWWRLVSTIRAAVCEEILFRGYAIERLQEISRSGAAAGIISCAIFALAHVGEWGWAHLLVAGVVGAILTLLYLWRRNIWANAIAHFIVDGAAFLLG